jgi:hypothetical protein
MAAMTLSVGIVGLTNAAARAVCNARTTGASAARGNIIYISFDV